MFPAQIREAIDKNTPVALALGVLEYHGEHLSPGVDTLLVIRALDILEKEIPLVILPPFFYGASSFAVEPPERKGTIHVAAEILQPFARQLFYNLLRIGFRNIHVFVHHQCENFEHGMPTDLSFKLAAKQEIFSFIEREQGEGWWGNEASAEYYEDQAIDQSPFNWISIHPFMSQAAREEFPVDHAGEQETSLMMAFCPEAVDMDLFSEEKWYSKTAKNASLKYGNRAKDMILTDLKEKLQQ
jgi:creatinine amidohydrolase